ncbi:MAG: serine hydrolase [Bryobacteraceae bacterium]
MLRRDLLYLSIPALLRAQGTRAPAAPLDVLRGNVERISRSINAKWGIYIKCIETGEEIALNADEQMDTMSVIKIPLMVEAFRQMEAGKFKLTDREVLRGEDRLPGTGIIRSLDDGAQLTIKDLLTMMIIVSANTATDMIFAKVGGIEPVNELMKSYGLRQTRATAPARVWFEALRAAPSPADFHREGKHPFGLSSARVLPQ